MNKLPVFTEALAECHRCELRVQCERGDRAYAHQPQKPSKLMIIGEGPGQNEILQGRPFVGRSGKLLEALIKPYNVRLDDCWITNATLCKPPHALGDKQSFMQRFPQAVSACLPRLESEIAYCKPRVIITLGGAALAAITGHDEDKVRRIPVECDVCHPKDRKIGPLFECSAPSKTGEGACKHRVFVPEDANEEVVASIRAAGCLACGASFAKQKTKRVACDKCGGRKTKEEAYKLFKYEYKMQEVAGAIIDADKYGWDQFGVKYIISTFHPSFVLRPVNSERSGEKKVMGGQFAAFAVQEHLRKAIDLVTKDSTFKVDFEITAEADDLDAAQHVHDYFYGQQNQGIFAADIETEAHETVTDEETGEDTIEILDARKLEQVSKVKCIGFYSMKKGYALVVDTRNTEKMPALLSTLRQVLADKTISKAFHHGTYDVPVIRKLWKVDVQGYDHDTLIAHHDLCPDETHTLAHLAFRYTHARIWKPAKSKRGEQVHESFDDLALYNARDVKVTALALDRMLVDLQADGLTQVYEQDMQLQHHALLMQKNGMPLDVEAARAVGKKAYDQREEALTSMRDILRDPVFNPNSPDQLRTALFDTLAEPVIAWTDGGKSGKQKPSTAHEHLVKMKDTPFKRALLSHRDAGAVLKSYFVVDGDKVEPGRALNMWGDDRVHVIWKPFGTRTGRYTTSPNAQNWAKWLRAMIKVRKGRKIVGADYDQLELRIVAALANDKNLIDKCVNADESRKLEADYDPHSYVASIAFGIVYTNLNLKDPKHDKENMRCKCETCTRKSLRDICKRVIYGLNYGAGDQTVLEAIYNGGYTGAPITLEMIAMVRNAIFKAFPGIPKWREEQVRLANKNRALYSPLLKRRRVFPLGDVPVTECYNFPIQSGGADIINSRMIELLPKLMAEDPTLMYIAQGHDAVYFDCDENKAEAISAMVTKGLTWTVALSPGAYPMPFTASATIADNWKDA